MNFTKEKEKRGNLAVRFMVIVYHAADNPSYVSRDKCVHSTQSQFYRCTPDFLRRMKVVSGVRITQYNIVVVFLLENGEIFFFGVLEKWMQYILSTRDYLRKYFSVVLKSDSTSRERI